MKRVLVLLCNGVEMFEAAAFLDVLGWSSVHQVEIAQNRLGRLTPLFRSLNHV